MRSPAVTESSSGSVGMNARLTTASEAVRNLGAGVGAGIEAGYDSAPAAARAMATTASPGLRDGGGWEYMTGLLYEAGGGAGPAYPVNGLCIL